MVIGLFIALSKDDPGKHEPYFQLIPYNILSLIDIEMNCISMFYNLKLFIIHGIHIEMNSNYFFKT